MTAKSTSPKPNRLSFAIPVAIFLMLLGLSAWLISAGSVTNAPPNAGQDQQMPDFSLPALDGSDNLAASDIKGPAVVNFFASWCAPCEAEHPYVTALARTYPVYGIGYMDEPEKLGPFLSRLGNPYTAVGVDPDGIAGAAWEVRGLPTSFAVNSDGKIIYRHDGPLTATQIKTIKAQLETAK